MLEMLALCSPGLRLLPRLQLRPWLVLPEQHAVVLPVFDAHPLPSLSRLLPVSVSSPLLSLALQPPLSMKPPLLSLSVLLLLCSRDHLRFRPRLLRRIAFVFALAFARARAFLALAFASALLDLATALASLSRWRSKRRSAARALRCSIDRFFLSLTASASCSRHCGTAR